MKEKKYTGRKKFLFALGSLGIGGMATWLLRRPIIERLFFTGNFDPGLLTASPSVDDNVCVLTSAQTEGPFYYPSPERSDVTEDRAGIKLQCRLQVIRYPECTPVENALVDIWHCDAEGAYSGYPEEITRDLWETMVFAIKEGTFENGELYVDPVNDSRYLRGMQKTDENGWVTFNTIIPGWYKGRVPHIHARVVINNDEQLTTQFYFREEVLNEIYTSVAPYDKHGACPMSFDKDIVLSQGSADGLLLDLDNSGMGSRAFKTTGRIGIQVTA